MRSALTRDLANWELGALSAAELELRHPGRAVGLVALYEQLSALGDSPVPDAEAEWDRMRELLPEHPVAVAVRASRNPFHVRRLVARPLALAAALVLLGGTIGYAAVPDAVNRQLSSLWESVKDFFGDEPSEDGPARLVEVELPGVAPPDYVKDDGHLGQHRSGDEGDRRERHGDQRRDSDEGSGQDSDTDGGSGSSGGGGGGSGGSDEVIDDGTDLVQMAKAGLDEAEADLSAIVDANPGTPLADKLEDALAKVQEAQAKLALEDDPGAVAAIEGAVGDLEAAVKDGLLPAAKGAAQIDNLVLAARLLAKAAIDEAMDRSGDPAKIASAKQALSDGDSLRASGEFKDAVNSYKVALIYAEDA